MAGATQSVRRLTRAAPRGWQGRAQAVEVRELVWFRIKPDSCGRPGCPLSYPRGPISRSPASGGQSLPELPCTPTTRSSPVHLTLAPTQYLWCHWCWAWQATLPRGPRRLGLEPRDQRPGVRLPEPPLSEEGGMYKDLSPENGRPPLQPRPALQRPGVQLGTQEPSGATPAFPPRPPLSHGYARRRASARESLPARVLLGARPLGTPQESPQLGKVLWLTQTCPNPRSYQVPTGRPAPSQPACSQPPSHPVQLQPSYLSPDPPHPSQSRRLPHPHSSGLFHRTPTASRHPLYGICPNPRAHPGLHTGCGGRSRRAASTHHQSSPTGQAWVPLQLQGPGSHPKGQPGPLQGQQASKGPQRLV